MDLLSKIPNSKLKEAFVRKLEIDAGNDSDIYSELQSVCVKISCELRQINELFPEYTPHDKDYHISHLFRIADIILGENKYEKLNIVELYLLVVTMYAHDWGMAVSKNERYSISTGIKPDDASELISLLDDESERFYEFANKKLGKTKFDSDDEIEITIWQEYIRNTHALRSAKRIQKYFQKINGSIAEALSKICLGHWLNIEDISDRNGYYTDASVYGEIVNLRALTIYIRLIDLFDLAEDRTPYVIWKYVDPQNTYSRMEWSKHRALHQITSPSYERGRVICICGSTDDHEVYAALLDFKSLCDKYFRECSDALAHMNNEKYELGVYFLDWRIEARNFKPINVQFAFERENIFEILSQEIYNCHPYVYIRELIQNSIDAITLRKEILDRKLNGSNIGYISLEVNEINDEDLEIICKDDGIGMDEYILREYFSVLGKSYYQSTEFKNKRLDMTPISKFGIGILSCFAVASQMIIYTNREPYMREGREPLKVIISDIQKQFRVQELSSNEVDVGTKIILKLKKSNLQKHLEKNKKEIVDFNITEYVKQIMGYVPYPIIVNEKNEKTIIVHPEYDTKKLTTIFGDIEGYSIYSIEEEYPVQHNVPIQDINNFNNVFKTKKMNLKKDLNIEQVEGCVLFSVLQDNIEDIINEGHCWPASEIYIKRKQKDDVRIRWTDNYRNYNLPKIQNIVNKTLNVYSKGILLENYKYDRYDDKFRFDKFPAVYIKVNYPNGIDGISVSRFENRDENNIVDKIWKEIINVISKEIEAISKKVVKYDFWKTVAINCMQFKVAAQELSNTIFNDVEFPFIGEDGTVQFERLNNCQQINLLPKSIRKLCEIIPEDWGNIKLDDWNCGKCLVADQTKDFSMSDSIVNNISSYIYDIVKQTYCLKQAKIMNCDKVEYPDVQLVFWKEESDYVLKKIFEILNDFDLEYQKEYEKIKELFGTFISSNRFLEFNDNMQNYFAYGCRIFNIDNSITHTLIKCKWMLQELKNRPDVNLLEWGLKNDLFEDNSFFTIKNDIEKKEQCNLEIINSNLEEVQKWLKNYFSDITILPIKILKTDFIPKTFEFVGDNCFLRIKELEYS